MRLAHSGGMHGLVSQDAIFELFLRITFEKSPFLDMELTREEYKVTEKSTKRTASTCVTIVRPLIYIYIYMVVAIFRIQMNW